MSDENDSNVQASNQLRAEIRSVLKRYGQESGITVYQAIGVLEVVKHDLVDMLEEAQQDEL